MTSVASQTGFAYRANNGIWVPRSGLPLTSVPNRPSLPSTSISMTPLSSSQALYGSGNFASALAATFALSTSSSPVASFYNAPYNTQTVNMSYTTPIYVMSPSAPTAGVYVLNSVGDSSGPQQYCNAVPIPNAALIPGGVIEASGTDGACLIICENQLWEFWRFTAAAPGSAAALAGYSWQATWGGYEASLDTWSGFYPSPPSWGVHANGSSWLMGLLRAEDYYSGTIAHVIGMGWPCTGNPNGSPEFIAPATRYDASDLLDSHGNDISAYQIPEGSWFRLPSSFDTVSWAASNNGANATEAVVEMVCRAIRDYGLVVNDSSGVIQFSAEGYQTFGSPYNPYTAAQNPTWGDFGQYLPWSQMEQIAPQAAF
jgi:hypothetical protein